MPQQREMGPRSLEIKLVVVASLALAGAAAGLQILSFEKAATFATLAAVTAAFGAMCWSIYRLFERSRVAVRGRWDQALRAIASDLHFSFRPTDPRSSYDWPEASGFVDGLAVKLGVVSESESPIVTGIFVYTPEVTEETICALAAAPKVSGVSIAKPRGALSTSSLLPDQIEPLLRQLAQLADGVDIDGSRVLVTASQKGVSWNASYDMETNPERLRQLIDGACNLARLLQRCR